MAIGGYSIIAREYYDPVLHPTCANFGELSHRFIVPRMLKNLSDIRTILEVGAGKSMIAGAIEGAPGVRVTLLDSSKEMLENSNRWIKLAQLIVADARFTGLADGAFDLVVSSLGDPYNTNEFWSEMSRVLRPRGACLFTSPASEWALAFRDADHSMEAEFVLANGETVYVPSFVPTCKEQVDLVERSGLFIEDVEEFCLSDLTGFISPKLKANLRKDNPVVLRGFQVRKV